MHAAAGGVGLAALQLGSGPGGSMLGTAGGTAKRTLLRRMGVQHVSGSRSYAFTETLLQVQICFLSIM